VKTGTYYSQFDGHTNNNRKNRVPTGPEKS